MELISSPETSVSHHLTLRDNPEDGIIQFHSGGSLIPRVIDAICNSYNLCLCHLYIIFVFIGLSCVDSTGFFVLEHAVILL